MNPTTHSTQNTKNTHYQKLAIPALKAFMVVLEKVSLVALAVLAAYTSPKLFFPFCGAGIVLGFGMAIYSSKQKCEHIHENSGGCSQGVFEQLTGVKLPPPVGLAINVAMAVDHIDHHSKVYVPAIGLYFGMWLGDIYGTQLSLLYRIIRQESQQTLQ